MFAPSDEFLRAIPKTDLHLHLDGSLRISTLIDLARSAGVALPATDEAGLRAQVFKDHYASLEEYLRGFALTTAVMQSEEALFRIAYELLLDNAAEGVRYIEARFAPQLLMSENLSFMQVMRAVDRGFRTARDELNRQLPPGEPEYDYGLIACAMRFFTGDFSPYYREFCATHAACSPAEVRGLASLELARAVVELRAGTDIQVVGFDLAGAENGFPAAEHIDAYAYAGKALIGKTVHAGEAYGAESIFQAVVKLNAERIGHGLWLFDEARLAHPEITDRHAYIERLVDFIAKRRITLEVCLTSNRQTTPEVRQLREHAFSRMIERDLSVTICTDNRLVSNTTVCQEYRLALENFALETKTLEKLALSGFSSAFHYRLYAERQAYLARVGAYYRALAVQYGVD